jgi:prepilin-type N-terminal cleavage/methylation domain-containing protein
MKRLPGKKSGFTLLEVIVALSLLATVVTVILQLFSSDLRVLTTSEDYISATVRAEAKMREVLDDEALAEGTSSEVGPDGYEVETTISKTFEKRTRDLPFEVLEIAVKLSWRGTMSERSMVLRTLKTVKKQQVGRV